MSASALNDDDNEYVEGPKWKESDITIPAFPNQDDRIQVQIDRADMPFEFYIDPASVSVGSDDIWRYTIVIESNSGASNVLHEGIRCSTNEYRTYAYGTYDNKFIKARVSNWKNILGGGAMAHRYDLKKHYLCSNIDTPFTVDEALQRIRYPSDF